MSVKIYDKKQKKWIIFPGTIGAPGKDAYLIAQENGYTGTKEEYAKVLTDIPKVINSIEEEPTEGSKNLITSGGVWQAIDLALKSYVDEKEIAWDKVTGKPETYIPAAHTHPLAQITDAGALAYKDKVDESDLNFDIPDGTVVDSSLSTSSVNPVQNKVVTEALNNRYTKSETYSQSEIDEKIGSAGGGDVMASGNLAVDYIIIGAGPKSIKNSGQTLSNLALKSEIPSLSGYATQSWVTGQGYSTENTWRPVKVGSTTLNDSSTTLTIANGTGIGLSFSNGTLTITNSAPGSSYTLPVAKNNVLGGIKTGYTESGGAEMAIYVLEDGTAYTLLKDTTVKTALGFTPANVNDIPEIPIALPNPYALNVTAGGSTTSYTGSSASTIDLDNIYAKKLPSVDTPGKPGLYFASSGSVNVTEVYVTENNPDAIILVANTVDVTFGENYHKMDGIDSLSGGNYKCYCITYVRGVVLVNGAIYG